MQAVAPPASRNARCPCGSGKRYKECHGALSGHGEPRLSEVSRRLAAGDFNGAEEICRDLLARQPASAEALGLLGRALLEQGHPSEALNATLKAVKAVPESGLGLKRQQELWSQLNSTFASALSGLDAAFVAQVRHRYEEQFLGVPQSPSLANPLVSVVLLARDADALNRSALASILRQTYRNIEIVVAYTGSDARPLETIEADIAASVPHRSLHLRGLSDIDALNAAIRASLGEFIQPLSATHALAETRIGTMLEEITGRKATWGFSAAAFVGADGEHVDSAVDADAKRLTEVQSVVVEADSFGFALMAQDDVTLDIGNLFFSRAVFDEAGGFRDIPFAEAWDFGLRALWHAEPVFVRSKQFVFRMQPEATRPSREVREAAQLRMFGEFYGRACGDVPPPNRYAPSPHHWGLHFYKRVFQTGHILVFSLSYLEGLAADIAARRGNRAGSVHAQGVNLVGFAFGEFGLAENLRAFAGACLEGGIPFAVRDVDMKLKTRQADRRLAPYLAEGLPYRCSLYCLNPDMLQPVRQLLAETSAAGGYNIGYWFWELDRIPREWGRALDLVDEIWVATEFVADAMRRATSKPVVKIPTPIEVVQAGTHARADFGLPEGPFLFLFAFDFNSFSRRKNPEAAVDAFRLAFGPDRRDVGLVIKSVNGANQPGLLRALSERIGADDRIVILDRFMTRQEVTGLQGVADAFVSLHRAEGLGLGIAESMWLGKPVIATGYSGNMEFTTAGNSCLVGYDLVPIAKGEYLYDDRQFQWAEPRVDEAAAHMRRLVDDVEFRQRIAAQGQHDIRARFTYANAAELMRARLSELGLL